MTSKDLGLVTAYAYAVSQGYTGTEEEFAELMASYATVAEEAAESAAEAAASAEAAGTSEAHAASSAASANQSATSAGNSATSASGSAVQAQSSATAAGQSATQAAGSATAAGNSATAAAGSASQAAASETAAGASATAAAGSATSAASSATAAAGSATEADASADRAQEILDSIPEDYSELSEDVANLSSALTLFDEGKRTSDVDLQWSSGFINNDGSIDTSVTTYHITRKIDALELNGGVITSDPGYNLYAYRYRKDGSFIFGYKLIGKVTTFNVPTDYFESNADVILEIKTDGYENVSAHGFEVTKTQAQIDTLIEESSEVPKVVMVDTLVALQDEQFDVMYDNIFVNYRAKDIPYKEIFGNAVCIGMENLVRFQDNTVRQLTGSIRYRNSITSAYNSPSLPDNVLRKAITVNTISASAGSGVTRKVLLIGDSWTAPGKYARELRNLFESEDEPMNITLLGTLGNGGAYVGPENGYHEGHGTFSSKTFCTKSTYNTYANAFYNPTTETFDFSYYMNNCGYSSVDDVFINLGINDVAEMQDFDEIISYWDIMINSIKTYNSNIKVFIGLCGLPAQYKYSTTNNNCNRSKARRLLFHERLISEYGNRESDGLIIVPLHLSIDTEHDFPTTQMARSYRDSTLVDYCTDNVHPSDIAYNKIADRIRTYIKYAETLS